MHQHKFASGYLISVEFNQVLILLISRSPIKNHVLVAVDLLKALIIMAMNKLVISNELLNVFALRFYIESGL